MCFGAVKNWEFELQIFGYIASHRVYTFLGILLQLMEFQALDFGLHHHSGSEPFDEIIER